VQAGGGEREAADSGETCRKKKKVIIKATVRVGVRVRVNPERARAIQKLNVQAGGGEREATNRGETCTKEKKTS